MRRNALLLAVLGATLLNIGGCPGLTTETQAPAGDPTQISTPAMSVTSTASILQFNALGLTSPQFRKTANLAAVISNASGTAEVAWSIQVTDKEGRVTTGPSFLAFVDSTGAQAATATGDTVTITATATPATEVYHVVTATATITATDGTQSILTAQIRIQVTPDPVVGGDSTLLTSAPYTVPTFGVDENGQVTLYSGVSGNVGSVVYAWTPVDPANFPSSITLPATLSTENITITVTGSVSGVFPFRVLATDSAGNVTNAIVNVYLGLANIGVDVRATRAQVSPGTTINLRTTRTGGVPDLDTTTADTFTYTWQILDSAGNDDTATATITPVSGTTDDDAINDWTVSGLATADVYRFFVTVTDSGGMVDTDSVAVWVTNELTLAVEASQSRVGTNTAFTLRTARSGGEAAFTYTFGVLDAAGTDASASTTITAVAGTDDWTVSGFATAGTYRIFATVTDGNGNQSTDSTKIVVGNDLTLAAEASREQVPVSTAFSVTTQRIGGTAPYTYTFAVLDSAGNDDTAATTFNPVSGTADADEQNTWAISGFATADTYRVFVTVTDGLGMQFTDVADVLVGDYLSLDVTASTNIIAPAAATTLTFNRTAGVAPFTFTYSVSSATGTFNPVSPQTNQSDDISVTWTAPAAGAGVEGSYRFDVTITDALGNACSDSTWIIVQAADTLALDVKANRYVVAPGTVVSLTFDQTGGSANYSYAFTNTVVPSGGGAGTFNLATPQSGAGDLSTVTWTAPAAGANVEGDYRIDVVV
ncbi:MAG: hypothetical protein KKB50_05900, partial [Planctomycetes bacterium]|nr:hypothetical protein [Planctomycetota bacterium]